jgi:DNA-dependent RNA polymerase auxiliary subunit epsilon
LYAYPNNVNRSGEAVAEWSEAYGFVPMVMVKHIDLGFDYGFSETHIAQSKIRELDDLTSLLSDQIRKSVNPIWLYKGIKAPATRPGFPETVATANVPEPWREEQRALYTGADADAKALVADLDIQYTIEHIRQIYYAIEVDYPELRLTQVAPDVNISGRALRLARQPVESKIITRRAVYDAKLEAALRMAISIGGYRGIFKGFGLDSYAKGDEEFHIAERPIFEEDPEDEALSESRLWEAATSAVNLGVPLRNFLQMKGYSDEELDELLKGMQDASAREEGL